MRSGWRGLALGYRDLREETCLGDSVDEWSGSACRSFENLVIGTQKAQHLLPSWRIATPQVEASHAVLFNCSKLRLSPMVSPIVTYENPPVLPDHRHPNIVSRISGEMVLVKLDRRW